MRKLLILITLSSFALTLSAQTWGDINYDGAPWVDNVSRPYKISKGLYGRHLTVWASHGSYYDITAGKWQWQRPTLFGTNEDLFTQTIVVPYLIPMLEQAGAVVFTPRERDWQRNEVIVDNDDHHSLLGYRETGFRQPWQDTGIKGFALHSGRYTDGENPFEAGTARMAEITTSRSKYSSVIYQPAIPEAGRYAVYVSYQTVEGSIDDAHYTVWHKGGQTESLFNGKDLTGWEPFGDGKWSVDEEGNLVTENGDNKQYGYLCTRKYYKDFDLTLEFKQESNGNSGLFFHSFIEGFNKVHGWQCEVAPKGNDTGGIYESYGRGWLQQMPDEKEEVLKEGEWNTLRLRVEGGHVQTWLNGVPMADLEDQLIADTPGRLMLQIHDGNDIKVLWRNFQLTNL